MGVARKWHFSTSGAAANLGVSGELSEHRGSGIPLLGITSLNRHFYAQIDWNNIYFFPSPNPHFKISAHFGKNGLGPQPAAYPFMTACACVFGHSIRQ